LNIQICKRHCQSHRPIIWIVSTVLNGTHNEIGSLWFGFSRCGRWSLLTLAVVFEGGGVVNNRMALKSMTDLL
jgi:hypothetical protein